MSDLREAEIRPTRSLDELRAAIEVRIAVFVDEQGGPAEDEPDEWDTAATQFVVLDGTRVVGTARLYEAEPGVAKIGRVAVLRDCRGRGLGCRLMTTLLGHAGAQGFHRAVLHAQTHACSFYRRFGFEPEGEEFMEGGIPHRRMRVGLVPGAVRSNG